MRSYLNKRFNVVTSKIIQKRYNKKYYNKVYQNSVYRVISHKFYKKYINDIVDNDDIINAYNNDKYPYKVIDGIIKQCFTEDDFITMDNMMEWLEPVDFIIAKKPMITKRHTIDNYSMYWNVVDIFIPTTLGNNYTNALKIVKEHSKTIINYLRLYVKEADKEIYNNWKFLKIDSMILTRDFQIAIKLSYKHDIGGYENE